MAKNRKQATETLIFLIQIYTGYYYQDLKNMKKSQLVKDPKYGFFIMWERDKNGYNMIILLLKFPHANYVLKKYADTDLGRKFLFSPTLFIDSL